MITVLKKTNIFLTIDLECRKGYDNYDLPIYGKIAGCKQQYGLNFILEKLNEYGLCATFFVEPFLSYKFGLDVLKKICDKIVASGQDIQLHIHPFFKSVDNEIIEDKLSKYSLDGQVNLINEAKKILLSCGVKKINAFRAGSFSANNDTYKALEICGIPISSNYNLDYLTKSCKININGNFNDCFYYENGILELPVSCFNEFDFFRFKIKARHMQITAVSFLEMKYIFDRATMNNIKNLVILFHTFEFIKNCRNMAKANFINIRRFNKLCEYISKNRNKFNIMKISDVNIEAYKSYHAKHYIPKMPMMLTAKGKFEQIKKRFA